MTKSGGDRRQSARALRSHFRLPGIIPGWQMQQQSRLRPEPIGSVDHCGDFYGRRRHRRQAHHIARSRYPDRSSVRLCVGRGAKQAFLQIGLPQAVHIGAVRIAHPDIAPKGSRHDNPDWQWKVRKRWRGRLGLASTATPFFIATLPLLRAESMKNAPAVGCGVVATNSQ